MDGWHDVSKLLTWKKSDSRSRCEPQASEDKTARVGFDKSKLQNIFINPFKDIVFVDGEITTSL